MTQTRWILCQVPDNLFHATHYSADMSRPSRWKDFYFCQVMAEMWNSLYPQDSQHLKLKIERMLSDVGCQLNRRSPLYRQHWGLQGEILSRIYLLRYLLIKNDIYFLIYLSGVITLDYLGLRDPEWKYFPHFYFQKQLDLGVQTCSRRANVLLSFLKPAQKHLPGRF